jgi:hypothetical protein
VRKDTVSGLYLHYAGEVAGWIGSARGGEGNLYHRNGENLREEVYNPTLYGEYPVRPASF